MTKSTLVKHIDFDIAKDRMIRKTEIAKWLGVSGQTVMRLVKAGDFPKPVHVAGLTRWVDRHIEVWLEKQRHKKAPT